jgi:hypothetical protein
MRKIGSSLQGYEVRDLIMPKVEISSSSKASPEGGTEDERDLNMAAEFPKNRSLLLKRGHGE